MKEESRTDTVGRKPTLDEIMQENARLRGDLRTIAIRISHDLRTPLGGLINTGELLKEIIAETSPATTPLVNSLFTSIDDLTKVIGEFRLISKASADPRAKEPVNMGWVVAGVRARLESKILKHQATITEPESWPEVAGVPDWLEFIWWNFLANALQHGGEGTRIKLGWKKEKDEFHFEIWDYGRGVPTAAVPHLFQPFDSLHQPGGTRGLGLSIVQRLVHLQSGSCGHRPNPEGGAVFYFTLPFVKG